MTKAHSSLVKALDKLCSHNEYYQTEDGKIYRLSLIPNIHATPTGEKFLSSKEPTIHVEVEEVPTIGY
jgi:hypothetical protein